MWLRVYTYYTLPWKKIRLGPFNRFFHQYTSSLEQDQTSSSPWSTCCIIVSCSPWSMCCINLYDALPETIFAWCSPWIQHEPLPEMQCGIIDILYDALPGTQYEPLLNSVLASLTFCMMLPLWSHISSKLIGTRRDRIIGTCLSYLPMHVKMYAHEKDPSRHNSFNQYEFLWTWYQDTNRNRISDVLMSQREYQIPTHVKSSSFHFERHSWLPIRNTPCGRPWWNPASISCRQHHCVERWWDRRLFQPGYS